MKDFFERDTQNKNGLKYINKILNTDTALDNPNKKQSV